MMVVAAFGTASSVATRRRAPLVGRAAEALPRALPQGRARAGARRSHWPSLARSSPRCHRSRWPDEATYAYEHVGLGEGHPASCLARGAAAFMLGDEEEALRWLGEGAEAPIDRPLVVANCLAHIAVVHIEHGRWKEATMAARQARALLGEAATFPSTALVVAVSVLVETHAGRSDEADVDRQLCRQHLTSLGDIAPWLNLQARVALARAAVIRGNRVEAAALVEEASAILEVIPDAVRVAAQLAGLRREVAARDRSQSFGPSSLTTAELRVLQLLPTHLSVAEIADRLYVSRNTVKSQTIAIYRKLGTSSRGGAVEIADRRRSAADVGRDRPEGQVGERRCGAAAASSGGESSSLAARRTRLIVERPSQVGWRAGDAGEQLAVVEVVTERADPVLVELGDGRAGHVDLDHRSARSAAGRRTAPGA